AVADRGRRRQHDRSRDASLAGRERGLADRRRVRRSVRHRAGGAGPQPPDRDLAGLEARRPRRCARRDGVGLSAVGRPGLRRRAVAFVRVAARQGARLILLPELFETPYFCKDQDPRHFDLARPRDGNTTLATFGKLAAELGVVLPISFFEVAGRAHYNSLVVI